MSTNVWIIFNTFYNFLGSFLCSIIFFLGSFFRFLGSFFRFLGKFFNLLGSFLCSFRLFSVVFCVVIRFLSPFLSP